MTNFLINFIGTLGLLFSIDLVRRDLRDSNYCPKFLKIPACYIVLLSFSIVLLSNTLLKNQFLYLTGAMIGLFLGGWFSYHELNQTKKCPRFFKIPLCFVSLISFILLILLGIYL